MAQEDLYRRVISNINDIDLDALSTTKEKKSTNGFVSKPLNTNSENVNLMKLPLIVVAKFINAMDQLIIEKQRKAGVFQDKKEKEKKIVEGLKSDKRTVNKYVGKGKPQSDLGPAFSWLNKTANKKTNFSPSIAKNLNIGN